MDDQPTTTLCAFLRSRPTVAATQSSSPFLCRIAICIALTVLNTIVVAKFAGVFYQATLQHPFERAGITLLFAALLGSLARTWFLTLTSRPR